LFLTPLDIFDVKGPCPFGTKNVLLKQSLTTPHRNVDMKKKIQEVFEESIRVKEKVIEDQIDTIDRIARLVIRTLKRGGKVLLCGNGGSAADSQHIACELVGRFKMERPPLPAIALSTNTSNLTSLANDYSYSEVFKRQVKALARKNDLLIGISTSGKASNVVEAIKAAKELGISTVAFTGRDGGPLAREADISFKVPSDETPRIQESHITAGHAICELVERELFTSK